MARSEASAFIKTKNWCAWHLAYITRTRLENMHWMSLNLLQHYYPKDYFIPNTWQARAYEEVRRTQTSQVEL